MRPNVKDLVTVVRDSIPLPGPIYEFGSYQVEGQEELADLRPLFPGRQYVGCDGRAGPGVDKVVDMHRMCLEDASVGTAISLDTFEHVLKPFDAASEIHRVLRPGGVALVVSVMLFPIHDFPDDFWRFTPSVMREIAKHAGFVHALVFAAGHPDFPHTVGFLGWKANGSNLERSWRAAQDALLRPKVAEWATRWETEFAKRTEEAK